METAIPDLHKQFTIAVTLSRERRLSISQVEALSIKISRGALRPGQNGTGKGRNGVMVSLRGARITLEPPVSAVAQLREVPFDGMAVTVARALGISLGNGEENLQSRDPPNKIR